jgi:hypothetical protein
MRASIIMLPLLVLAGCNVSTDDKNDTATVQYNQDLAENVAADVSNQAGAIVGHVANDVEQAADTVKNEVGSVDVDVDVSRNGDANANAN